MSSLVRPIRAFTLVELLVVVAIIAVLIGVLIPSVRLARSQANRTVCMSNLRQVGIGIQFYTQDSRMLPRAVPMILPTGRSKAGAQLMAAGNTGLMALPRVANYSRQNLVCPEGWASGGKADWYDQTGSGGGFNKAGTAYMDYAYWAGQFPPANGDEFDVYYESFQYRLNEKKTKILTTDTVVDLASAGSFLTITGAGNHAGGASPVVVPQTDGLNKIDRESTNVIGVRGMSVLFSDYHVEWYTAEHVTQSANGLAFPPCDEW
jgi:prepilin-type N-terminal cleavage/methylation domain-containing protein